MKCSPFRAESAKCPSSTMRAPCRWDTVGPEGSEQLAVSRQPNPQSTDFNRGQSGLWRSGFRVSGPKSSNRCQPVRLRLMAVPHRLHVPNLLPPCRALDAQIPLQGGCVLENGDSLSTYGWPHIPTDTGITDSRVAVCQTRGKPVRVGRPAEAAWFHHRTGQKTGRPVAIPLLSSEAARTWPVARSCWPAW